MHFVIPAFLEMNGLGKIAEEVLLGNALRRLGHRVTYWSVVNLPGELPDDMDCLLLTHQVKPVEAVQAFRTAIDKAGHGIMVQWVTDLLQREPDLDLLDQDHFAQWGWLDVMRMMDLVLVKEANLPAELEAHGVHAAYMDQAASLDYVATPLLRLLAENQVKPDRAARAQAELDSRRAALDDDDEIDHDLVAAWKCQAAFCGTPYPHGGRLEFLRALKKRLDLEIFAAPEQDEDWREAGFKVRGAAFGRKMATLARAADVIVGINARNDVPGYHSNRVWLTLAAGGHYAGPLTPGLGDVLVPGESAFLYDRTLSPAEAAEAVAEHLNGLGTGEHDSICGKGFAAAVSANLYEDRCLEVLLPEVEKLLSSQSSRGEMTAAAPRARLTARSAHPTPQSACVAVVAPFLGSWEHGTDALVLDLEERLHEAHLNPVVVYEPSNERDVTGFNLVPVPLEELDEWLDTTKPAAILPLEGSEEYVPGWHRDRMVTPESWDGDPEKVVAEVNKVRAFDEVAIMPGRDAFSQRAVAEMVAVFGMRSVPPMVGLDELDDCRLLICPSQAREDLVADFDGKLLYWWLGDPTSLTLCRDKDDALSSAARSVFAQYQRYLGCADQEQFYAWAMLGRHRFWLPCVVSATETTSHPKWKGHHWFAPGPYGPDSNIYMAARALANNDHALHVTTDATADPRFLDLMWKMNTKIEVHSCCSASEIAGICGRCDAALCLGAGYGRYYGIVDAILAGTPVIGWTGLPIWGLFGANRPLTVERPTNPGAVREAFFSLTSPEGNRYWAEQRDTLLEELANMRGVARDTILEILDD